MKIGHYVQWSQLFPIIFFMIPVNDKEWSVSYSRTDIVKVDSRPQTFFSEACNRFTDDAAVLSAVPWAVNAYGSFFHFLILAFCPVYGLLPSILVMMFLLGINNFFFGIMRKPFLWWSRILPATLSGNTSMWGDLLPFNVSPTNLCFWIAKPQLFDSPWVHHL